MVTRHTLTPGVQAAIIPTLAILHQRFRQVKQRHRQAQQGLFHQQHP